jgi:hypothetical protein
MFDDVVQAMPNASLVASWQSIVCLSVLLAVCSMDDIPPVDGQSVEA